MNRKLIHKNAVYAEVLKLFGFQQYVTHETKNRNGNKKEEDHDLNIFKKMNGFIKESENQNSNEG